MIFTWLNKQGVRSETGYEVQCVDRFTFEYREGSRIVTIESEDGLSGGMPAIIIAPTAFDRWDDGIPISKAEKGKLLENFRLALDFQGFALRIEEAI